MTCYFKKILSVLIAVTVISIPFVNNYVGAVAYEGKGTKSSPYLVKTAEQLVGMSENLSACYKLSNTIDLTSIPNFKPIGYLAKPFTGKFTCDLNSDRTPKYIIKNLKITVDGKPGYTDYVKSNSHWEAGLFGATDGAQISGIAVVDYTLKNTVEGKNQMNSDYSKNPGMDEQAAGGLIAIAKNTTVTGCIATGKIVESKCNWCGGLIGECVKGNKIKASYAVVEINTTGLWCHGGLTGGSNPGDTIENCFSSGNLSNAGISKDYTTGGFIGTNGGTIKNCYSDASVCAGGSSFCGRNESIIQNCYSTGKISGSSSLPIVQQDSNITNCYILNEAGCVQKGFVPSMAVEILSKLGSSDGWQAGSSLPVLSDIKIISDFSSYVPEAVTIAKDQVTENPSESSVASSEATKVSIDDFKILDDIKGPKNMTVDQAYKIIKLKQSLIDMTPDERSQIGDYAKKVNDYYTQATLLVVNDFTEKVENLPKASKISDKDCKDVEELWDLYQSFPDDLKTVFTKETTTKLEDCHKAAEELKSGVSGNAQSNSKMTTSEKVIVIVLLSLSVIALAGSGVILFFNLRLVKKQRTVSEISGETNE